MTLENNQKPIDNKSLGFSCTEGFNKSIGTLASLYTPEEPISAIATALAPSAIGVVRTSGKNCITLISKLFSRPQALLKATGYSMLHGWILDPINKTSENTCARIDEVMLGIYKAPKSYTGEDMVEIFCHGGTAVVLAIQKLLLKNGFRQAERGEFSFRAFINGKTDLTRAEAVREIIDSRTDESRSRAAGRLSGSLYTEIERIKQLIVRTIASIEAEIEYPEDEEAIADAYDDTELKVAYNDLVRLESTWASEKLYQDGARIVLCGRTNAGKSSLFNALLKEDRAIVSDIEGTTRDWIESWVSFGGIPARLFDTAGLRNTDDIIEKSGVERSKDLAEEADLVLYVVDSTTGFTQEDSQLWAELFNNSNTLPVVIVWNKVDKLGDNKTHTCNLLEAEKVSMVDVSVKSGLGIDTLTEKVRLLLEKQANTSRLQAGLGSLRQKEAVDNALDSVKHALNVTQEGLGLDAVVQDLEDALSSLGEITGEISPDDILGNIFSRFCVGK